MDDYVYKIIAAATSFVSGYLLWAVKRRNDRLDEVEDRLVELEKQQAVLQVKISGIRHDTQEIKGLLGDLIKCNKEK